MSLSWMPTPSGFCCELKAEAESSATSLPMARTCSWEQGLGPFLPMALVAFQGLMPRNWGDVWASLLIFRLCSCPQESLPLPQQEKEAACM